MVRSVRALSYVFAMVAAVALCGCFPSGSSQADEEKEPHFLAGKSRVSGMDYQGAIEEFERALDVNPRSAAAHYELGILLGERANKPAAAIYHYEKFLELRPGAGNADIVQQHIQGLKQELAKGVLPLQSTPEAQQQVNQLMEENRRLKEELERLRASVPSSGSSAGAMSSTRPRAEAGQIGGSGQTSATPPSRPTATRTYRVESGDTPASIARKYHLSLDSLLAANPGLNPRRMQVGQNLNIPGP